jgi:hypothetical protein
MCGKQVSVLGIIGIGLACGAATANAAIAAETAELKVSRAVLFSSGVGFFERAGTVSGDATVELKFRAEQINDILKSLVVQDLDGGTVGTVGYASQAPVAKTLKSFAVDLTGDPTMGALLNQLRGEPVEITAPRRLTGTIVGVEKHTVRIDEKTTIQEDVLTVLAETGLEQIPVRQLQVRLSGPKIDAELRRALATLATTHDADKKSVVLRFEGQGERRVCASYLLEAPIWKTSYRLELSDDESPWLQGWAIVENATAEDWDNVELALVSGRPISFTMDLYSPIYVPRPHEELELYASLRPPSYGGGGFGGAALAATEAPAEGEGRAAAGRRARGVRRVEELGVKAAPARAVQKASAAYSLAGVARDMDLAATVVSVAAAEEAGELFKYTIAMPVSIARQRSAMLPIVTEDIAGRKVSIYNENTHKKYPLNGLELTNTTDLNLMQGPVTVFDGGTYAGDAKLPDLQPGEKRLIAYALDLTTEVMIDRKPHPEELLTVKIVKGVLWHQRKYVDERSYNIKNKGDKKRTILIEQPYGDGWKLIEPEKPYDKTDDVFRFEVEVPAGEVAQQKVRLQRVRDQSVALLGLDLDNIRFYIRSPAVSQTVKSALEKIIELKTELDQIARQRDEHEKRVKEATEQQARVRENLKTLDRNTDAYKRQLVKFDDYEDAIEEHTAAFKQAAEDWEQKQRVLERYVLSLNVE